MTAAIPNLKPHETRTDMSIRSIIFCLSIAAIPAAAQDRPPLERYVTGDAAVVFSFRDLPGVWERMQGLSFMKAIRDPALKPFLDSVKKELSASMEKAGAVGGIEYDKLAEIVRGQVLISVRMAADAEGKMKPEMLVLADVEGKEELVRSVMDRAVNKAVQDGKASKRIVGDVTILSPSGAKDAEKDRFCYAMKGGLLVGADKPETCAKLVQSLPGGPANPLIQNTQLQKFRRSFAKHARGIGDVEMYVLNAKALSEASRLDDDRPPAAGPLPTDTIQAMGFSLCFARGEFETLAQLLVVPKDESSMTTDNTMPGRSLPTDPWAPENASAYMTFNIDVDKVYEQMAKQLETLGGGIRQIEEQLKQFPDPANPLITSIKKDVIDPLGDRISLVLDRGEFQGRTQFRLLFAWKLRDSDRITRLVSGGMTQLKPILPMTEKDVKGFNVYVFPPLPDPGAMAGRRGGQAAEPPIRLGNAAVAVTKSHLFATTHVEMIDRTLQFQGQAGLAEYPPAAKALGKAPEAPGGVLYIKAEEFGRLIYSVIASEALQKQATSMASGLPKMKDAVPDLSKSVKEDKLPPFEELRKHFTSPAGGYLTVEDGAAKIAIFSLK